MTTRLLTLLLTLGLLVSVANAQKNAAAAPEKTIAIRAATLIDGVSLQPRHNVLVVVRGNRIVSVSEGGAPPADATVISFGPNVTVLPGLIDTHTHLFLQGEAPEEGGYDIQLLRHPASYRAARATVSARRCLEQGFTTIRDVETEGAGYGDIGIKEAVNGGFIPGPRIFASTRAISVTGGYPLEGYNPDIVVPKGAQLGDGPVQLRRITREQLENGADWIKVYMTHRSWVDKQGHLVSQPTLTVEELKAVVDEAHGQQHKVACHAYGGIGLHRALDGGCDSIEHGLDLDSAAITQMLEQGTWYVPTLGVYYTDWSPENTPDGQRDRARAAAHEVSFKNAMKAGLKIAFGTDMGGIPWTEPIAEEFSLMVKFGMAPMDAIKSATSRAADLLDRKGELGMIAPGALADIVATQSDPLAHIEALKNVTFVMKDGKVFKQ
ncbi:MAG TPA: amidohydrolase family protein [Candidatus Saccharimonadales bacterium]|jgi:imidazolonepropionase-like amidohydrolase|nr:amidohydrolase family protein [Candidatus Saccharimonadales bacterium]